MSWHGVNLPLLLIGLVTLAGTGQLALRWANAWAVAATDQGLVFDPSMFRKPIAWTQVADVQVEQDRAGLAKRPVLVIERRDGRRVELRGVEHDQGQAERFAALARDRAAAARPPSSFGEEN